MEKEIQEAIRLLNENNYVVIPVTKGQVSLCDNCNQIEAECRYNAIGYACTNLRCLNPYIKEQLQGEEV